MTKREKINEVLASMSLGDVCIDLTDKLGADGPSFDRAISRKQGREVCSRLQAVGIEADCAPDAEDPATVWVYVCSKASELDESVSVETVEKDTLVDSETNVPVSPEELGVTQELYDELIRESEQAASEGHVDCDGRSLYSITW